MPLALLAPGDLIINSWVFSALLQSGDQHGHNIYDPSQSSTYQELTGSVWSIAYGDDISAPGLVRIDTVTVRSTTAQSQAIELASQVSSSFVSDVSSDGLLGLAFNNINTVSPVQQSTFFETLVAEDALDAWLIAAYLPQIDDGAYDFGFTDFTKYSGDLVFVLVDNLSGFWEL